MAASSVRARGSVGRFPRRASHAYEGVDRAQLVDVQRARLLAAMFDVVAERGAGNVSVAHVVERSGVSRRTFYEIFEDREDCFLAAFEQALDYARERVLPAFRSESKWRERIRVGLGALLSFIDDEPVIGKLLMVESLSGGRLVLARRNEIVGTVTRAIEQGGREAKTVTPEPLTAEGIVGGVLAVIHSRLTEHDSGPLLDLLNPLMSMIVLPYLGTAAARRELEKPPVASKPPVQTGEPLVFDPFKAANMRLTYRTVCVLLAVAENPGASNRTIGSVAGMKDQGQISKLLSRLERIGLIANSGLGPGSGAPNSWTVTSTGRQIVSSFQIHTQAAQR